MSNIPAVNSLITAINFDRFSEIEAHHRADAVFQSFRGPTLRDSVGIADWHREFLRDYADCNYTELEYAEEGNTVAVRGTIEAKAYDWRPFTQRVIEVFTFDGEGEVSQRRLYGMLRDISFDKPTTAAMNDAMGFKGGSASATRTTVKAYYDALLSGDSEAATAQLHEKAACIDGVYGIANGAANILDFLRQIPMPAFGRLRVTNIVAGEHDALVELAIDPARPRFADWVRVTDGKIRVIEGYAMLRELGVNPYENYANDRHRRLVIMPN
ncbi:MAG TPA: nuclear transport factor 2 family protein [Tepidiformaceae bacterium]|nr:nuclear transport factor 2 family protein [Tepidiformaceae bacterium]